MAKTTKKEEKAESATKERMKNTYEGLGIEDLRGELQSLKLKVSTGEEKDTSKVKKLKKTLARKLTEINNKK